MRDQKTMTARGTLIRGLLAAFLTMLALPSWAQGTAEFAILPEVVAPDVSAFTATISDGPSDITMQNSGFEPIHLRTRLMVAGAQKNRIHFDFNHLNVWGYLRSGAWDGAEVDVFRVIDGEMVLVRSDRVAVGGHVSSKYRSLESNSILSADATEFQYRFDGWTRPEADFHFMVRAVDTEGRLGPPSQPIKVRAPVAKILSVSGAPKPENPMSEDLALNLSVPSPSIGAPENLKVQQTRDGAAKFSWTPPSGRVGGYRVYIAENPSGVDPVAYLDLEGEGAEIRAQDMVLLRKKLYRADRAVMLSDRYAYLYQARILIWLGDLEQLSDDWPGGLWELKPHDKDTPVTDAGETYLSINYETRIPIQIGGYAHSGQAQTFYPVLKTGDRYTVEAWMRGIGTRPVVLQVNGFYSNPGRGKIIPAAQIKVGREWQKYSFEFEVPYTPDTTSRGKIQILPQGAGRLDVDNFRVFRSETGYMEWTPEDVGRLKASGMSVMRTHGLIKLGLRGFDLEQATNAAGGNSATRGGATLMQNFQLMQSVGMDPWIQMDPHFSRTEWLGFVEYLAAPYDPAVDTPETKPWAAKRYGQGYPEPWVDHFDQVLFEIGNETWNGLFWPWVFSRMLDETTGNVVSRGAAYGLYHEYVLSILRESPYWPNLSDKFVPVLGGWSGLAYGANAAKVSPNTDILTIAAYNGGWDEGEGPVQDEPFSYANILTHAVQVAKDRTLQHLGEIEDILHTRDRPLTLGTYEAGPGYALNGLNGASVTPEQAAEQERVMKSNAAGTATLDTFLLQAQLGMTVQNFFTYSAGQFWRSHAADYLGGQTYPSWSMLSLFNRLGTGDMLAVRQLSAPSRDLPALARRPETADVPLVATYATRNGDRVTIFAISRRVPDFPEAGTSGDTKVTIGLPFETATKLTRYSMTGGYRATNVRTAEASVVSRPVAVPAAGAPLVIDRLPPGETMIFVFEGVSSS